MRYCVCLLTALGGCATPSDYIGCIDSIAFILDILKTTGVIA